MKLRGITRLAAAAAATALLVGGLAAPAHAGAGEDLGEIDFPGAVLLLDEPVWAGTAPVKGCAGIDTGAAVPGKDGWLFDKPAGKYTDLQYVFLFIKDDGQDFDDIVPLVLDADGVYTFQDSDPGTLAKKLTAGTMPSRTAAKVDLPTAPAPAGVSGSLVDGGGWLKTPAGWALAIGIALTDPLLPEATFKLVRACAAAADASPSPSAPASPVPSSPAPGAGPQLPVTGTNVWVLSGAGVALIATGALLFMAYRRRQRIRFVA